MTPATAHELRKNVSSAQAIVVEIQFANGRPFAFENYEIYRAETEMPYQVGKTDQYGRVAFLPNTASTWIFKTYSQDGHGATIKFESDGQTNIQTIERPLYERYARLIIGVSLLIGIFGVVSLYQTVKRR